MEHGDSITAIGSLSIDESLGKEVDQNDEESIILNKTLNLSLDDPSHSHTPSLSPFYRHFPSKPSPLRSSVAIDDPEDSEMLDENDIEEDSDLVMEDVSNVSFTEKIGKTTSLMMSPTILGAKVATSSPIRGSPHRVNLLQKLRAEEEDEDGEEDTSNDTCDTSGSQDHSSISSIKHRHNRPFKSSGLSNQITADDTEDTQDTEDITELDTSFDSSISSSTTTSTSTSNTNINTNTNIQHYQTPLRWSNQPIQLQMHHHHYYPSTPQTPYNDDSDALLPAPWSKSAKPKAPAPYLISSYLQLIFNAITSGMILYVLLSAIKTVRSDINSKMEEYQTNLIIEIQYCSKNYYENKCDPETRVAGIEKLCIEWERCMNRDPTQIASKSSVSAETLGVILNSLIEPIGAKAIVVFVLGFIVWSFTSNFIFGFVRAKSYYGWNSNQQDQQDEQQLQVQQQQHQQAVSFNQTPMKSIQMHNGYYTSTPQ